MKTKKKYYKNLLLLIGFLFLAQNFSIAQDISTMSRIEIAQKYAPMIHMGVNTGSDWYEGQDILVAVDHDYNWGTYDDDDDVWASDSNWPRTTLAMSLNAAKNSSNHDATPVLYYSFIEMADFYIITYHVYHTYNEVAGGSGDHLNDMEDIQVLVNKSGGIKGALTTVHATTTWGTPWATDDDIYKLDVYANNTYKLHLADGTHPEVWQSANSVGDANKQDYGHAIFVQNEYMDDKGIQYRPSGIYSTTLDVPVVASAVGDEVSGWSYNQTSNYLLVPIEELHVKAQMSSSTGDMYEIGEAMGSWSNRFWGTGYFNYAQPGNYNESKALRKRYNDSYAGPDMGYTFIYNPPAGVGKTNSDFVLTSNHFGSINTNVTSFGSFYRNGANLPGYGFFYKDGNTPQAENLNYWKIKEDVSTFNITTYATREFNIEAGVRRVGKLHLEKNWFSNPDSKSYKNNTGPMGGIMIRGGDYWSNDMLYVGYATEREKAYVIKRDNIDYNLVITPITTLPNKYYRHFRVNISNSQIKIYASDYRSPGTGEILIYTTARNGSNNGFLPGTMKASLLTISDVESDKNFYWTNVEYTNIKYDDPDPTDSAVGASNTSKNANTKVALSVEEDAILNSISLFPNPATDAFSFTIPTQFKQSSVNVSISDISGKVVQSAILKNNNTNKLSVKTNTLSNGLYFVKIDIDNGASVTKKLLINK